MAEAATITCPGCRKTFKGRLNLDGKKIRCKHCGNIFLVRLNETLKVDRGGDDQEQAVPVEAAARPVAAHVQGHGGEDEPDPYGVHDIDLRARCPNCAGPLESDEAVVCLHCGYNMQSRVRGSTKKTVATTHVDRLTWLMPGLICAGSVFLLILFCLFFCLGLPSLVQKGSLSFLDSEAVKWWTVILSLGGIWGLGRVAFNRLVLEPTPPEVEKG